jgi:hypothetical protein
MPTAPPLRLAFDRAAEHGQRRAPRPDAAGSRCRFPACPVAPRRLNAMLLLVLALGLAACGGSGRPCRFDDLGDQMLSTREAFLERMAGCPIGGRD